MASSGCSFIMHSLNNNNNNNTCSSSSPAFVVVVVVVVVVVDCLATPVTGTRRTGEVTEFYRFLKRWQLRARRICLLGSFFAFFFTFVLISFGNRLQLKQSARAKTSWPSRSTDNSTFLKIIPRSTLPFLGFLREFPTVSIRFSIEKHFGLWIG